MLRSLLLTLYMCFASAAFAGMTIPKARHCEAKPKQSSSLKIWIALSLALLAMTFASAAYAADDQTVTFLSDREVAKHEKTITRLEDYLSGLTTIVSDFTQVAPDGSLTSGKFFLQRPGKMRWQYNPPTPILMVSNGSEMVYYDYELEQVSHIPLDVTLVGFLAQENITFDGMVGIVDFFDKAGVIRITVAQHDKPNDGKLMLEFSDKPLQLRNMVVTDAQKQVTTVSLNNAQYGVKLDKHLFEFKDPRQKRYNR